MLPTPLATTGAAPAPVASRLPALDGLRGLAILLVLGNHFLLSVPGAGAVAQLLAAAGRVGWIGVDLFFVLSGFLITGILLELRGRAGGLRRFYARRALRIWPLYLAVVAGLVLAGGPAFREVQGWYWLHSANILLAIRQTPLPLDTTHFWSLAVEEQFYLVWPALVLVVPVRWLPRLCAAVVVAAVATRAGLLALGNDMAAVMLLPARMDALAIGAYLACAARSPGGLHRLYGRSRAAMFGAGLVFALLAIAAPRSWVGQGWAMVAGYTLVALGFAALLVRVVVAPARGWSWGWLRWLGTVSYGIYVLHAMIRGALVEAGLPARLHGALKDDLLAMLAFAGLGIGSSLLAAAFSWHAWERHWLALKDRVAAQSAVSAIPGRRLTANPADAPG